MKRNGALSGSELRKKIEKRIQNENDRKINSKPMENHKHITGTG